MKLIFKADALLNKSPLTLCILETPKWVFFTNSEDIVCYGKKDIQTKKIQYFKKL